MMKAFRRVVGSFIATSTAAVDQVTIPSWPYLFIIIGLSSLKVRSSMEILSRSGGRLCRDFIRITIIRGNCKHTRYIRTHSTPVPRRFSLDYLREISLHQL